MARTGMQRGTGRTDQIPFWGWVVIILAVMTLVGLAVITIVHLASFDHKRCFTAHGALVPSAPTFDSGFSVGRLDVDERWIAIDMRWQIPDPYTAPVRIVLHGPCNVTGVGASTECAEALTICGGVLTDTCAYLESRTCVNYVLSPGCGRLQTKLQYLDSGDSPVLSTFFNISGLTRLLLKQNELFYVSVETGAGELHRGWISGPC